EIIEEFKPDTAALETLFFFKNQTTVMQVAETRGIIISNLLRHNVEIFQYTPRQIKSAVAGHGAADKTGVEKLVRLQLKLPEDTKIIDDTYDALAALLTHAGVCKVAKMRSKFD
ncbi:MAG: crossover junction endodeoxyribonuclease RuvC, partial [bacterium]|nr:crossover junction endodeoxyribonuclease RuvC [bacterium]